MTNAGRLGICKQPSRSMGSDAAAANDAGIITAQHLFGRRTLPSGCLSAQFMGPPPGMYSVWVFSRRRVIYTTSRATKDRKAIARAVFGQDRFADPGKFFIVLTAYDSLGYVSRGLAARISLLTITMSDHKLFRGIYCRCRA